MKCDETLTNTIYFRLNPSGKLLYLKYYLIHSNLIIYYIAENIMIIICLTRTRFQLPLFYGLFNNKKLVFPHQLSVIAAALNNETVKSV